MPIIKRTGLNSQVDSKVQSKRKQIIEEERIRVLGDALMCFYDKLIEKYDLIHKHLEEIESDEMNIVIREEVEEFAREHAATKPIGY